ncbi:MAG: hypothetical protein GYB53_21715 [Rhodobacteraceae bacterium]|nr:hypothetical protein [Paracoccaceae bacterium]MBR9823184.1 hypothetical protein [Paracoccaceae bacterium]
MSDTTDWLPLRAEVPMAGGGRCIMSGFPGLETGVDGLAWISPEMLEATLAEMTRRGARRLLVLTEPGELPEGAMALLETALERHRLRAHLLPIRDFGVPGPAFLATWRDLGAELRALLKAGGVLAVCCQYGAGRSGLITALLLIEGGLQPRQAVARVRDCFGEAIESPDQMDWLLARPPGHPAETRE